MMQEKVPLWRKIQRENFTSLDSLCDFLQISNDQRQFLFKDSKFVLNLPLRLAIKIEKNNLQDPIFLQFVPLALEQNQEAGFVLDPVQDKSFCKTPKMLQKYNSRALLVLTGACVMHCRFCFRQNFPYESQNSGFEEEIEKIKQDTSLQEIVLSGGDPLSLSNRVLQDLFARLEMIPHIQRIRFHTRFPIGIPERIDAEFLEIISQSSKQIYFVIHTNHPKELDLDVLGALQKLRKLGVCCLNQSVLLKGVNDDPSTLLLLCQTLSSAGVIPYYLHKLDRVIGTSHFQVSDDDALMLVKFLQKNLSGYAVPRLVQEEAGKPSKTFVY